MTVGAELAIEGCAEGWKDGPAADKEGGAFAAGEDAAAGAAVAVAGAAEGFSCHGPQEPPHEDQEPDGWCHQGPP